MGLPSTATRTARHLGDGSELDAGRTAALPVLTPPGVLTVPCVCGRTFLFPLGALRHACPERDVALAELEAEDL